MNIRAHRARVYGAVGTVLLIAAVAVLIVAWRAQRHAPRPPATAAIPAQVIPSTPSSAAPTRLPVHSSRPAKPVIRGPLLPRSTPVRISIPAIGVTSTVQQLGLAADGTVQVPPLGRDSHTGWYKYSPTPGQLGPSIVLGHIDSAKYGPGVFYRLGDLRQHDRVAVTRADRTVAVFEIERVVEYPKKHFPTLQVYGNLDHAGLRLITCGGKFDPSVKSYEDNIVAYASLVSSRRA